jgi:hypothetical protein
MGFQGNRVSRDSFGLHVRPGGALPLGSLDEFRIYNRVLSVAEVRYLAGDR